MELFHGPEQIASFDPLQILGCVRVVQSEKKPRFPQLEADGRCRTVKPHSKGHIIKPAGLPHNIIHILAGAEQNKRTVRMPLGQIQTRRDISLGKKLPGMNAHGFTLTDQSVVGFLPGGVGWATNRQGNDPGDVKPFFCFEFPDSVRARGTSVVAQVHTEGQKLLLIHIGKHIPDQSIVSAVFIGQHPLGRLEELLLKPSVGEIQRKIHQIAGTALGGFLNIFNCLTHHGLHQDAGNAVIHGHAS